MISSFGRLNGKYPRKCGSTTLCFRCGRRTPRVVGYRSRMCVSTDNPLPSGPTEFLFCFIFRSPDSGPVCFADKNKTRGGGPGAITGNFKTHVLKESFGSIFLADLNYPLSTNPFRRRNLCSLVVNTTTFTVIIIL